MRAIGALATLPARTLSRTRSPPLQMHLAQSPARRLHHLDRAAWNRIPASDRLVLGAKRFAWLARTLESPFEAAGGAVQELVEVAVDGTTDDCPTPAPAALPSPASPDATEPGPLTHLVCEVCGTEVWWPAELAGGHLCLQCGGVLELAPHCAPPVPSPAPPSAPTDVLSGYPALAAAPLPLTLLDLFRAGAEAERRAAQIAALSSDQGDASTEYRLRLGRAHRLENLAMALAELDRDGLDALLALVESADPATAGAIPADDGDRRVLVSRARVTAEALHEILAAVQEAA